MKRRSLLMLLGLTLIAGLATGSMFDTLRLETVQANPLALASHQDIYAELDSDKNVLLAGSRVLSKIATLATPSVVHIQSERRSYGRGMIEETGSGVVVKSSSAPGAFIVTNRHVIHEFEMKAISIHMYDGQVLHPQQAWYDEMTDVAVMKVSGVDLQPARWGDSDAVEIGSMVLAMGSPFGLSRSITYGIISAKGRSSLKLGKGGAVLNQYFLQTDAAINPGNSGGPLIDLHGRVVGINTAIASNSGGNDGIGFSIPSNLVRYVVEQLIAHGKVERAYLGVQLDPDFDFVEARKLKLDRPRGARIVRIYPNTPASRANLQPDDVVFHFNDINVHDENHLINLVSLTPIGRKVLLDIFREGVHLKVEIDLADRSKFDQKRSERPALPSLDFPVAPMGLVLHRIDGELAIQLGLNKSSLGLLVLHIDENGPLAHDIELYDVIEAVAGRPVASREDFERILNTQPKSGNTILGIRRLRYGNEQHRLVIWNRGWKPEPSPAQNIGPRA